MYSNNAQTMIIISISVRQMLDKSTISLFMKIININKCHNFFFKTSP